MKIPMSFAVIVLCSSVYMHAMDRLYSQELNSTNKEGAQYHVNFSREFLPTGEMLFDSSIWISRRDLPVSVMVVTRFQVRPSKAGSDSEMVNAVGSSRNIAPRFFALKEQQPEDKKLAETAVLLLRDHTLCLYNLSRDISGPLPEDRRVKVWPHIETMARGLIMFQNATYAKILESDLKTK